ncbi:abhydrolase domain-containing protein 2 isoform X2 [Lycorma delicatula]|uniref:abhydrolase domain-containing protein 2 isoform X2 n=1 Tax=Lycorma delicatula TaxID=130591 RepID=UPI003F510614
MFISPFKSFKIGNMSTAILAAVAVILCILFRILNVNSQPQKPVFFCKDLNFLTTILKIAPILENPYIPTRLWGFSGHVQTIVHSIIGRVRCPWPIGERTYLSLSDGTTLTYDLYQPIDQSHDGYTGDFNEMLHHLTEKLPNTKIITLGYSMGGNIVTKYMGELDREQPANLIGGISICQGYDAIQGTKWLLQWQNFRRFYLYAMTEAMKSIVLKHRHILLSDEAKQRYALNEREIIAAATLPELDDAYTRKVYNFKTVEEMYRWSSCVNYLKNIRKPMIFINARDDPLVPDELLQPIRDFASTHNGIAYMEVAHGGHLGFYEGGLVYPNPVAWLDRTLVALIGSIVLMHNNKMSKESN